MNILYLLIPISLIVVGIAIWAFIWALKSGQFDDMEGPAHRILMDDDDPMVPRMGGDKDGDSAAEKEQGDKDPESPDSH
jgi:cbb3-type cytochrome oxidase maturation protein